VPAKIKTPIPRRIRVGARQYSIDIVETMLRKRDMGRIHYDQQRIELGKTSNVTGRRFAPVTMQENFWHEIVHAILDDMGRDNLNRDEKFVQDFAERLTQVINSARFK
jgi:hypothetical protein